MHLSIYPCIITPDVSLSVSLGSATTRTYQGKTQVIITSGLFIKVTVVFMNSDKKQQRKNTHTIIRGNEWTEWNEVERQVKVENRQAEFLVVSEKCITVFWPTTRFKREDNLTFLASQKAGLYFSLGGRFPNLEMGQESVCMHQSVYSRGNSHQ